MRGAPPERRCTEATTCNGIGCSPDRVTFFMPFLIGLDVPERAAVIAHEARHATGNFGHEDCARGEGACDQSYGGVNGGAYSYEVVALREYSEVGSGAPYALRVAARQAAQVLLDTAFLNNPGIQLGPIPKDSCGIGQVLDPDNATCIACDADQVADQVNDRCLDCAPEEVPNGIRSSCVPRCDPNAAYWSFLCSSQLQFQSNWD